MTKKKSKDEGAWVTHTQPFPTREDATKDFEKRFGYTPDWITYIYDKYMIIGPVKEKLDE